MIDAHSGFPSSSVGYTIRLGTCRNRAPRQIRTRHADGVLARGWQLFFARRRDGANSTWAMVWDIFAIDFGLFLV
jgi:hypothetical protein